MNTVHRASIGAPLRPSAEINPSHHKLEMNTVEEALASIRIHVTEPVDISVCERTIRQGRTGQTTYTATVTVEGGPCCESRVSLADAVRQALHALGSPQNIQEIAELLAHEWRGSWPYVTPDQVCRDETGEALQSLSAETTIGEVWP
jgi:hypothetical protein